MTRPRPVARPPRTLRVPTIEALPGDLPVTIPMKTGEADIVDEVRHLRGGGEITRGARALPEGRRRLLGARTLIRQPQRLEEEADAGRRQTLERAPESISPHPLSQPRLPITQSYIDPFSTV